MAKIVIVEDNSLVAMGMRIYLESRGHEVIAVATSGAQAIAVANQHQPDLLLMDVGLQGDMDGVDAARAIRAEQAIPIIFLSGSGDAAMLQRMHAIDSARVLLKPVAPLDLASEVEKVTAGLPVRVTSNRPKNQ